MGQVHKGTSMYGGREEMTTSRRWKREGNKACMDKQQRYGMGGGGGPSPAAGGALCGAGAGSDLPPALVQVRHQQQRNLHAGEGGNGNAAGPRKVSSVVLAGAGTAESAKGCGGCLA